MTEKWSVKPILIDLTHMRKIEENEIDVVVKKGMETLQYEFDNPEW